MDASIGCSEDQLRMFLERVTTFTQSTFTILNIQALESSVLELLVGFLSDSDVAKKGFQLHLLQHGDFITSSPWVRETAWDDENLLDGRETIDRWKDRIRDGDYLSDLFVVSSSSSSSGKTRMIRGRLQELSSEYETGSLTVHEQSTLQDIMKRLQMMFSSSKRALHVSICLGSAENIAGAWVKQLNYFFFSFLVLRGIVDPVASTSCSFDMIEWKVFIEVPARMGMKWVENNIPVLFRSGDLLSSPPDLVVSDEMRRVCTYLRAFESGTINRKFNTNKQKRVVLLIDCSGSMQGGPFRDARNNAVSIFDSHVVEGDVSKCTFQNSPQSSHPLCFGRSLV